MKGSLPYDAFISHAYEDKKEVADLIYTGLVKAGFKIWYSGMDIPVGGHLEEEILSKAIPNSRFGILVISPHFLQSDWTRKELKELKKRHGSKAFLTVLHNVRPGDIRKEYPFITERFCISTDIGINEVVLKLIRAIKPPVTKPVWLVWLMLILIFSAGGIQLYSNYKTQQETTEKQLEEAVEKYSEEYQQKLVGEHLTDMNANKGETIMPQRLTYLYGRLTRGALVKPEQYTFTSSYGPIRGIRQMQKLNLPVSSTDPIAFEGSHLDKPFLIKCIEAGKSYELVYALFNETTPNPHIEEVNWMGEDQAIVKVGYEEPLRYVRVDIECNAKTRFGTLAKICYKGFKPHEKYFFQKQDGYWKLTALKN